MNELLYMQLEPRVFFKMNKLPDEVYEIFAVNDNKPLAYDLTTNKKTKFTLRKNIDVTDKYTNDILNSINNKISILNDIIIEYDNDFYIQSNAYISDIPEFNLSIDKAFEDFHECLNNPYEVEYHKGYYLFSDIESFKNFITKMDKNLFYNCNQNVYNEFINNLDTFFKNKLGIFMLKVHLNRYALVYSTRK